MFQVIARTSELLENSNEQRRKQEKALEEKQEQINNVETNMKSVTGDVIKVIRKSVGTPLWSNGDRYLLDPPYWPKRLSQNLRTSSTFQLQTNQSSTQQAVFICRSEQSINKNYTDISCWGVSS